jgi:hypothetical protein
MKLLECFNQVFKKLYYNLKIFTLHGTLKRFDETIVEVVLFLHKHADLLSLFALFYYVDESYEIGLVLVRLK